MNNLLNLKSPAQEQAAALKADYGLENHGLTNLNEVYWNLPIEALYEEIIFRGGENITNRVLSCRHGETYSSIGN